ncbi:uncharacterized protein DS421_12g372410 [Arachis hypogaea]|nr:uncharacterized protein DS421_12g372410 [Arachis hypogaea]
MTGAGFMTNGYNNGVTTATVICEIGSAFIHQHPPQYPPQQPPQQPPPQQPPPQPYAVFQPFPYYRSQPSHGQSSRHRSHHNQHSSVGFGIADIPPFSPAQPSLEDYDIIHRFLDSGGPGLDDAYIPIIPS